MSDQVDTGLGLPGGEGRRVRRHCMAGESVKDTLWNLSWKEVGPERPGERKGAMGPYDGAIQS